MTLYCSTIYHFSGNNIILEQVHMKQLQAIRPAVGVSVAISRNHPCLVGMKYM